MSTPAPGVVYEGLHDNDLGKVGFKPADSTTASSSKTSTTITKATESTNSTEHENNDAPDTSISRSIGDATLSHKLATADIDVKGAVQSASDTSSSDEQEVANLGWHKVDEAKGTPFISGWTNEEVWLFIRRFNKQIYRVKVLPEAPPGDLDLNCSDEEFSPDKLRSNIERFYMTVLISLIAFGKHIVRIRSWRETRRTSWFCTVYSLAWMFDIIFPVCLATILGLVLYPRLRIIMFPPAPIALVGGDGGVQKPAAGVLGSHDSATGAPENFKGEAVEQEASNFVNGLASVALSSAAGKHAPSEEAAEGESSLAQDAVPDPTALASGAAKARNKVMGGKSETSHDKTKVPMEAAMWAKMRPVMHGINTTTDDWERAANSLSPKVPFPKSHRYRFTIIFGPLFLISMILSSYMFIKIITFGVGFAFFGDPIFQRVLSKLHHSRPHWYKMLELRNNILHGVPTNAQLTVTLLRVGEARKAPLPPPPRYDEAPPDKAATLTSESLQSTGKDSPLSASDEEINAAARGTLEDSANERKVDEAVDTARKSKHGHKGSRILGFFKGTTRATMGTAVGVNTLKAKAGSKTSQHRLGALQDKAKLEAGALKSGPVEFVGRYHGKKGKAHIISATGSDTGADSVLKASPERPGGLGLATGDTVLSGPVLAFATDGIVTLDRAQWQVPVSEISQLNKIGGYGWKAKLVIGWALHKEVQDGLEVVDRAGVSHTVMGMPLRDELFNRLIAMGDQRWEAL